MPAWVTVPHKSQELEAHCTACRKPNRFEGTLSKRLCWFKLLSSSACALPGSWSGLRAVFASYLALLRVTLRCLYCLLWEEAYRLWSVSVTS